MNESQRKHYDAMKPQVFAIIFVCAVIATLFIVYGYFVYPPPNSEGYAYAIPAIQFANKHLLNSPLIEPFFDANKAINPYPHANRMLYYPPLLPMALGYTMMTGHGTPENAYIIIAVLNSIVLILSALLFYKIATLGGKKITWLETFCIIFGLLGIATSIYAEQGRPESLARLFVVLAGLGFFAVPKKYHWLLFGVLLGFMGATHTVGSLMFGLFAAVTFAASWNFKKALKLTLFAFLIGIAIFIFIVESGPYHVIETFQGIWANANSLLSPAVKAQERISLTYIRDYYLLNPQTSFYGPLVLLLFFFAGKHFLKNRKHIASPALFSIWAGALAFLTLGFLFYFIHLYYIVLFAPIIFAFILYNAVRLKGFLKYLSVAIITLTSIGFLRSAALFPFFAKEGVTLSKARNLIANEVLIYGPKAKVGVTGALWAFFKDYDNKYVYIDWRDIKTPNEGTTAILFKERYHGENTPPDIPNCKLKENYFTSKEIKIWKIKLANTIPGYAFALYECDKKTN